MLLKKILLTGSILSLTTSVALAIGGPSPYVGISTGLISNGANKTVVSTSPSKTIGNFRGIPLNFFGGYGGEIYQNIYLAGELFGTAGTANISNKDGLKTTYSYGLSALPGVMLNERTLAYARIGVIRSRFANFSSGRIRTGGQFGAGLQTCLTQNLDLRGEYDYVTYNTGKIWTANNTKNYLIPHMDQFTLGLVYKFS